MKKLKLLALATIGIAFVFIVGCTKKGDTGPAGPAGPAGPDSIFYSQWTVLNMALLNVDTQGDSTFGQTITASTLTSSILNKGVILSYIGIPGGATNGTDTLVINTSDVYTWSLGVYITQDLSPGIITLYSDFNFNSNANILYRYVLIPGTILATNSILKEYTKEQLKAIDYSTISKALNLNSSKKVTD